MNDKEQQRGKGKGANCLIHTEKRPKSAIFSDTNLYHSNRYFVVRDL